MPGSEVSRLCLDHFLLDGEKELLSDAGVEGSESSESKVKKHEIGAVSDAIFGNVVPEFGEVLNCSEGEEKNASVRRRGG